MLTEFLRMQENLMAIAANITPQYPCYCHTAVVVTTQNIRNHWKSRGRLKIPPLKRKSTEQSTYLHSTILYQKHKKYHQVPRFSHHFLIRFENGTRKAHLIHLKRAQWELCFEGRVSLWISHLHTTTEKLPMRQKDKLALSIYLWLSYSTPNWNFNILELCP